MWESAARDYRRFAETHPRAHAAGSLRPRVQRHPASFAEQEVHILEVAFIVGGLYYDDGTGEKEPREKEDLRSSLRIPRMLNLLERRWRDDPFPLRRTYRICRRKKIFISRVVALLPKHGGEKVRKRYFAPLSPSEFTRATRERAALLSRNARQDIAR